MKRIICRILLLVLTPVFAQAITVTNTNDSGAGSLRAAVTAAANGAVIDFDPALIASGSATITLSSVINITTFITINGLNNATDTLYISGNSTSQIFNINTPTPAWTDRTYLNNLTLINGRNTGSYGGAIYCADGSLEVNNCVIRNCSAQWGGAIAFIENHQSYNFVLVVNNCSLYGNTVTRQGGAIFCDSPLSQSNTVEVNINGSTIYNNNATLGGSAVYCSATVSTTLTGGGDARSTVRINKSTICNNLGTSAIHLYAEYSNNSVSTARSYLYLYNSTVVSNGGNGIYSYGESSSAVYMRSSIFAFNNLYTNYQNTIISYGSNIFSAATITGSVAADQMGATLSTLALGSLSYNGGITRTKVPQLGSIAIDMGNPSDVSNAQNAPIVGRRDAGAAEFTTSYGTDAQVACGPYTWIDGLTYTANNTTATHTLVNSIGFDSIVTLNLTIYPTYAIAQSQTICQGESYTLGTQTLTTGGQYSEQLSSVYGCDSIINLTLMVNPNSSSTQQVQACGSYQWIDGNTYASSNSTATFTLPNAAGCDSVVTLDLTILNATVGTDVRTECDSYQWIDGITYTSSNSTATFTLLNAVGCDSVVTLALTVLPSIVNTQAATICFGESYTTGTSTFTSSGTYTDVFTAANGCDSTRTLTLTVLPQVQTNLSQSICIGESFAGYTTTGTYTDVFTAANGCDSTRTLNLTVLPVSQASVAQTICFGESFEGYTATGTYTDVLTAANGCDSTRTLTLTVLPLSQSSIAQTICSGESFAGYTATGIYTDVFTGANGCDSTRTLTLTVLPASQSSIAQTVCFGESFAGYTATGTYTDVFVAANGCDSTRTLNLTVLPLFQTNLTESICFGESFEGYTATGTYTDVFANVNGCDSTRTLILTVLPVSQSSIAQTICSGESFAGYTATGTYTDVFAAANGCDSTRTLTLTVLPASQSSIVQTICSGESFAGYTATGTYTDVYVAANGCDSTRTLNLTVLPQFQTNLTESICFGESFAGYTATGTYTDVFTSINGCDSTRTLVLTVHDLPAPTIAQNGPVLTTEAFTNYQWLLDGSTLPGATAQSHTAMANGDYTVLVTDANGCMAESEVLQMLQVSISNDVTAMRELTVFPNPSNGQFTIALQTDRMTRLTILDMQGKLMHDATVNSSLAQVNLALPEGIYLLQMMAEDGKTYNKLLMIN